MKASPWAKRWPRGVGVHALSVKPFTRELRPTVLEKVLQTDRPCQVVTGLHTDAYNNVMTVHAGRKQESSFPSQIVCP